MDSQTGGINSILRRLGYSTLGSSVVFLRTLELAGISPSSNNGSNATLSEDLIAEMVRFMVRSHTGLKDGSSFGPLPSPWQELLEEGKKSMKMSWDVDVFVQVCMEMSPQTDWDTVVRKLDASDFLCTDPQGFQIVLDVYRLGSSPGSQFPLSIIFQEWAASKSLFSMIVQMVQAQAEVLDFGNYLGHELRPVVPPLDLLQHGNQDSSNSGNGVSGQNGAQGQGQLPGGQQLPQPPAFVHAKPAINAGPNSALNCLDVYETFMRLTTSPDCVDEAEQYLESLSQKAPELAMLGLAQTSTIGSWTAFHRSLVKKLVLMFLMGHPNASFVLLRMWAIDREMVTLAMQEMYADNASLSRILDVAHELKAVGHVLRNSPPNFALDVALLAARREFLNLEKWLHETMTDKGETFVKDCLRFLHAKIVQQINQPSQVTFNLSVDSVVVFFRVLQVHSQDMSVDTAEVMKEVYDLCIQAYPRLMSLLSGPKMKGGNAIFETQFSEDVEQEVNVYYLKLYRGELTIADMIKLLQQLRDSKDARQEDVYSCLIHNLFDEYKFFPKYPEKELQTTAILFGAIINNKLVSYVALGLALRYVLDALCNSPGSKMFKYGCIALTQFVPRLQEWPPYCQQLLALPHLATAAPRIHRVIQQQVLTGQSNPPTSGTEQDEGQILDMHAFHATAVPFSFQIDTQEKEGATSPTPPTTAGTTGPEINDENQTFGNAMMKDGTYIPRTMATTSNSKKVFSSLQADRSLMAELDSELPEPPETPTEQLQDKIYFIINNLSGSNIITKVNEMKDILETHFYNWFSGYLVAKRVTSEPNFHTLYMQLLEEFGSDLLIKYVLFETYANVGVLINSDVTMENTQERNRLKYLGNWLGMITLARNKPIVYKHLAVKELLIEAFEIQRLAVVIPFVCKILEQIPKSTVFRPGNPWVKAILRLLIEIYHTGDLRLTLKFEIEVLLKNLGVDMESIDPSSILDGRRALEDRTDTLMSIGVDDLPNITLKDRLPTPVKDSFDLSRRTKLGDNGFPVPPKAGVRNGSNDFGVGGASGYGINMQNAGLSLFANQPAVRRLVQVAMERAIREIIVPVVERSVTIAAISTRELILKDFAMDGDEGRLRRAAHMMVQNLASSLALVTCKEPLRISMVSHLRSLMLQNGFAEHSLPEHGILATVADNMDFACSIIEKAAMEKALPEIDDNLLPAILSRRKHRERTNRPYYDMSLLTPPRHSTKLPDPLRMKANGLTNGQLRIYEDFASLPPPPTQTGLGQQQSPTGFDASRLGYGADAFGSLAQASEAVAGTMESLQLTHGTSLSSQGALQNITSMSDQLVSTEQRYTILLQLLMDLEKLIAFANSKQGNALAAETDIKNTLRQVIGTISSMPAAHRDDFAMQFSQKVVQNLYKNNDALSREVYLLLLRELCEMSAKVNSEIVSWFLYSDDDRKLDSHVVQAILKIGLVKVADQDSQLAKHLETGRQVFLDFAVDLVRICVLEDPGSFSIQDFAATLEVLYKFSQVENAPQNITNLISDIRRNSLVEPEMPEETVVAEPGTDGVREQLAYAFAEWVKVHQNPAATERSYVQFLSNLYHGGILKVDDVLCLFIRICTELCVESYPKFKAGAGTSPTAQYHAIDAFAKLIILLVQYHNEPIISQDPSHFSEMAEGLDHQNENVPPIQNGVNGSQKSGLTQPLSRVPNGGGLDKLGNITRDHTSPTKDDTRTLSPTSPEASAGEMSKLIQFTKIISIIVLILIHNHETKGQQFNQKPFFRLFSTIIDELHVQEDSFSSIHFHMLSALCNTFHTLQPYFIPGFTFGWLSLISHRHFMTKLLLAENQKGWPLFQRLLMDLFKFLVPFLKYAQMKEASRYLYRGTLRVLLVLLHDFPEFLCDYHFSFCDVFPFSCVQLRNLILSAFPRNMRLPDPFTPNLKVDRLPEIQQPPRILSDYVPILESAGLKQGLDQYLQTRKPESFIKRELRIRLLNDNENSSPTSLHLSTGKDDDDAKEVPNSAINTNGTNSPADESRTAYSVALINALVLYVGVHAISQLTASQLSTVMNTVMNTSAMDIYVALLQELDTEGRYIFLSSIANQLRYPNSHTHYFSCVLLHLFSESDSEPTLEQITRVLLERLIVNRPHPWGLLITFIELIKNPKYSFWNHSFTRCSAEIERLFESVARSINQTA